VTSSIRADLTYGTAYGLAASALFWSLQLVPPVATGSDVLLVVLAAAAGAVATTTRGRWRLRPTYPVVLAALLLSGPFVSCAAGWAAVLGRCVSRGSLRTTASRRRRATRLGLRLSRVTLASVGAALVFGLSNGPFGDPAAGSVLVLPVVLHALAYGTTRSILVDLTALGIGRRVRIGAPLRRLAGTLPGCLAATAVGWAAAALLAGPDLRLPAAGLTLLAIWAVHRLHGERLTAQRRQTASMVELRRAVTRALAQLMEERDPSTQDHLRRVHRLCIGVGKSLEMSDTSLETLAAAALLHDIGKISVPENILNKPGTLTAVEMDRVKRHPIVGAEIVQALPFRHALAPLVRHHHERWDGDGYPDGLTGERIPLGARILATVDCYDALTSDRPYRKALDHREAAAFLEREAGAMFDPDVVDALLDYLEARRPALAGGSTVDTEQAMEQQIVEEPAPSGSLALAQRELETLYDISRATGYGLNLEEFLTLVGCRLSSLVPFQSLVIYFADHDAELLRAHFAMGRGAEKLRLMTVPIGERLSGWAALEQRAVIGRDHLSPVERDGSRSDLEEWENDPVISELGASLAAPMVAEGGLVGVLTLYDAIDRGFTAEDKRILARVAGYVSDRSAHRSAKRPLPVAGVCAPGRAARGRLRSTGLPRRRTDARRRGSGYGRDRRDALPGGSSLRLRLPNERDARALRARPVRHLDAGPRLGRSGAPLARAGNRRRTAAGGPFQRRGPPGETDGRPRRLPR
jgi:putative nucleotidyltransferase with HDIG domain